MESREPYNIKKLPSKKLDFLVKDIMDTLHIADTEENIVFLKATLLYQLCESYKEGYKNRSEKSELTYDLISESTAISDFMDWIK